MSIIIQSGGIEGYKMIVDRFGRARVFSTSTTQEHHAASVVAEAFSLSTNNEDASPYARMSVGAGADGILLAVENRNAAKTMSIQKMTLAASAAGLNVTLVKNGVFGTLANEIELTAPNINFNSGNVAQVNAYKWDGVGSGITGITGGDPMEQIAIPEGTIFVPMDGSYIIGSGNTLVFHVSNPTAGAIEVALAMRFFFESVTA
jgi:hypothetical protein